MTTRADRRLEQSVRHDHVAGLVGVRTSRFVQTAAVQTRAIGAGNDPTIEKIQGWINEIGRFIDPDGLVTALSPKLVDWLDARYSRRISLGSPSTLTITGGMISVIRSYHVVAGFGGAADNLDTISGGEDGDLLVLRPSSQTITVRHAQDNISLNDVDGDTNGDDCTLAGTKDKLVLIYDGATSNWCEIARSDNNQA